MTLRALTIFLALSTLTLPLSGCGGDSGADPDAGGESCVASLTDCGGVCTNTDTDNANCGSCGNVCGPGEACDGTGQCTLSCQDGLTDCDGLCTNLATDNDSCGSCGNSCAAGTICDGSGQCALSCQDGLDDCAGLCTNTAFDPANCGACGVACEDDQACVEGACELVLEALDLVFLTSANGAVGFHQYDIVADEWTTLPNPPEVTRSQITNDGQSVYLLGIDNMIYRYDVRAGIWAPHVAGAAGMPASTPVGFFSWFDRGFYYCKDGTSTMHVYRDNLWSSFTLLVPCSSAGSLDEDTGELYVRTYQQMGFQVIDTLGDSVARVVTDSTVVGENSRTGAYYDGGFYVRTLNGPIQRLDAATGTSTDTLLTPISDHTSTAVDVRHGLIYVGGYFPDGTSFEVLDPVAGTLTPLADSPDVPDHSSLTVMRAP